MVDRITSSQVAKRAGVSQSAVSRFYTPGASVSAKTAEKVKIAASELGYRPNICLLYTSDAADEGLV